MKTGTRALTSILCGGLLLLGGLAFGVTANAANASSQPAATQNSNLTEQVRHNLAMLPWYGVFDNLQYQVNGDEVTLSGQVTKSVIKDDAQRAVKGIEGVSRVVNNVQLLPLSTFDDQTRFAEYRSIYSQPRLTRYSGSPVPQIHIVVANGHVTLEGKVASQTDKNVASIAANEVPGVFSVTNNLQVE